MSFLETTPRDLANYIGISNDKHPVSVEPEDVLNLPIVHKGLNVVGSGDWGLNSSSRGSCVLSIPKSGQVLKMPLGATGLTRQEAQNLAVELRETASWYTDVSTATSFVLASNGPNDHMVLKFQNQIKGKPASETSFRNLIKITAKGGFDAIVDRVISVVRNNGVYDLSGLLYTDCSRFLCRVRNFLFKTPWFSDNIMIDECNNCYLTDNTPLRIGNKIRNEDIDIHTSQMRKYWNLIKKVSTILDRFV